MTSSDSLSPLQIPKELLAPRVFAAGTSKDSPFYKHAERCPFTGVEGTKYLKENKDKVLKNKKFLIQDDQRNSDPLRSTSVTHEVFSKDPLQVIRETVVSRHQKYKTFQQSGSTVLAVNVDETFLDDYFGVTNPNDPFEWKEKPSTTFRDSYSRKSNTESLPQSRQVDLKKSIKRFYQENSSIIPSPTSRPSTTGLAAVKPNTALIGERLNTSSDPKNNTLTQRTWLYHEDPCLTHFIKGIEKKSKLNSDGNEDEVVDKGMSLRFPSEEERKETRTSYGRRLVLTGNILSKTGAKRAGIFLDENNV